ncbi:hypothetical protein L1281_000716 [Neisseria sp. HSC-16F19]|nr:hypothetical protein [Neisseria sp. HSC-16F19]
MRALVRHIIFRCADVGCGAVFVRMCAGVEQYLIVHFSDFGIKLTSFANTWHIGEAVQ